MARLQPFEVVREVAAGSAGVGVLVFSHYALTLPHWGLAHVDLGLALGVALLVYAGVHLAWATRPGRIERWLGLELPLRPKLADDDPESLREALRATVESARPRVSEPLQRQLDRIVDAVDAVLAVGGESAAGREAAYTLRATVTEYLPDTLERYLRLPRRFATRKPIRDGKTARDLASEQLAVLAEELESIAEEVHRGNAADLAAHGRFLDERFSRQDPLK